METKNPIVELRERLGVSYKDIAIATGANYASITNVANGVLQRIPTNVLRALQALGVSPDAAQEQYRQWRAQEASRKMASVQASAGNT